MHEECVLAADDLTFRRAMRQDFFGDGFGNTRLSAKLAIGTVPPLNRGRKIAFQPASGRKAIECLFVFKVFRWLSCGKPTNA
jgi:hypothetical protein